MAIVSPTFRIQYPTTSGRHILCLSQSSQALRSRTTADTGPSTLLRSLARLCPKNADLVHTDIEPNIATPALRAKLPYLRVCDTSRRTRPGTVAEWLQRVLSLRVHANRNAMRFQTDVINALQYLDVDEDVLDASWLFLCDARAFAVDVAVALAVRPKALLLDGRAQSVAVENCICDLAARRGVPIVWDGCAVETAHRSGALKFPPMFARESLRTPRRHKYVEKRVSSRSGERAIVNWARSICTLILSWLVLRTDALAYGVIIRDTAASTMNALSGGAGAVDIPWWRISTLLVVLGGVAMVSARLGLGISRRLAVAAVRCFVQLGCLGLVLVPIIAGNNPVVVLTYLAFMILVAATEAAGRPPYVYKGLFWVCWTALGGSVVAIASFVFPVVLGTGLEAQYIIPVLGMVMGNGLSGISVGVSNVVTCVAERKDGIEALLALGATRWEATRAVVKASVVLGLTPILNMMSVTGLVSIPGMMTGQIIGGTSPGLAARYQLVIMYVIAGSGCSAVVTSTLLTVLCLTDDEHRIRSERLSQRSDRPNMLTTGMNSIRGAIGFWNSNRRLENSVLQVSRGDGSPLLERMSNAGREDDGGASFAATQDGQYGAVSK